MKRVIILQILIALFLVFINIDYLYAEDRVITLKNEISSLERQKIQLGSEKQAFVNQGDELSYKIEESKRQSASGLGIIGKFRLSQNLRKAQNLSENIQNLDRNIFNIDNQIKEKKNLLNKEYELQVNLLIQKLNKTNDVEEKKVLLDKIKEYQSLSSQLRSSEQREPELIDIAKIEIKEHDSPKDIREKADLVSDIAKKTNTRISIIDSKIVSLKDELKTRKKLDEFADEISFFGERVARGEITSKSTKEPTVATGIQDSVSDKSKSDTEIVTNTLVRSGDTKTLEESSQEPLSTGELSVRTVMKSNKMSAELSEIPQSRLEEELKILEKQKQELKKELSELNNKSNLFRKKADELEKTGIKTGENQGTNLKKQGTKDNSQEAKHKAKGKS